MKIIFQRSMIAALSFLFGVGCVLFYPFQISEPGVTVEVFYMHYACGECYVQYKILAASDQDGKLVSQRSQENDNYPPVRFIGWDVLVSYKGDDYALGRYLDEDVIKDPNGDCWQPSFRLKGQLKRKLIYALMYSGEKYDGTYFDAQSAVAIHHPTPKCKREKEVPL
jgi:hypothetical protein